IRSKSKVRELSDTIKRLMQDPEMPVTSGDLLLPADPSLEDPVHFNLADEIATALENRFELGQQQFRIDSAGVALEVAKNNLLPTLNLVGQAGLQGIGENFGNAWTEQTQHTGINYQVGLQFEIPIGNRAARAVYQRARLQQQQAIDQYRNLI